VTDLNAPWVAVLGTALLESLWQIALIGALAAASLALLRGARAHVRYWVACFSLLATLLVPAWSVIRAMLLPALDAPGAELGVVAPPPTLALISVSTAFAQHATPWMPWIVALWAIGAAGMALRMALGLTWVQRLRRSAEPITDTAWLQRAARLAAKLRLTRRYDLLVADVAGGPISAGLLRPFVIVPAALLARMPPAAIEALIAHELAHIKRHDYLINLLQSLIETLLFYHPVVWWLSRRIRIEREHAADDLATRSCVERDQLATALVELDLHRQQPLQWIQPAEGGVLMSRIRNLISPRSTPVGSRSGFAAIGIVALLAAVLAHAQTPDAPAAPDAPDAPDAPVAPDAPDTKAVRYVNRDLTYALVDSGKQDGFAMSGSLDDLEPIRRAQRERQGKFVWLRQSDRVYVIDDPKVVTQVEREFAQSRSHDAEMARLNAEMQQHSSKVDALAARIDQLAGAAATVDTDGDAAAIEALAERQVELASRSEDLARRINVADERERDRSAVEIEAVEAERAKLDMELRNREAALHAKVSLPDSTQLEIQTLEQQIRAASAPMEPLGERIEALAERQAKAFEASDQVIRKLLAEARAQGLARPWPTRL
jgi:beta-lactamase regulating signal transducer with metallopeptidase domain/CII-binding regulator of phage lambda lysogenization HflD